MPRITNLIYPQIFCMVDRTNLARNAFEIIIGEEPIEKTEIFKLNS